ncbi:MAG TPA: hypothetical protein VI685_19650 [Candidatus Angelobacter sp.]
MQKTQTFKHMHLHPTGMRELDQYLTSKMFTSPHSTIFLVALPGGVLWQLDTIDQFLEEYSQSIEAVYRRAGGAYEVEIANSYKGLEILSEITVRAPDRHIIDEIFQYIEIWRQKSTIVLNSQPGHEDPPPPPPTDNKKRPTTPKPSRRDRKRPCHNPR